MLLDKLKTQSPYGVGPLGANLPYPDLDPRHAANDPNHPNHVPLAAISKLADPRYDPLMRPPLGAYPPPPGAYPPPPGAYPPPPPYGAYPPPPPPGYPRRHHGHAQVGSEVETDAPMGGTMNKIMKN